MIRRVGNYRAKDGTPHRMSGKEPRTAGLLTMISVHLTGFLVISTYSVFRTILLSVISLLNEPNTSSPANVDASVMYRRFKDSKGRDKEYENIIRYVFMFYSIFWSLS